VYQSIHYRLTFTPPACLPARPRLLHCTVQWTSGWPHVRATGRQGKARQGKHIARRLKYLLWKQQGSSILRPSASLLLIIHAHSPPLHSVIVALTFQQASPPRSSTSLPAAWLHAHRSSIAANACTIRAITLSSYYSSHSHSLTPTYSHSFCLTSLSITAIRHLRANHDHTVHAGLYQASLPLHLCNPSHSGPLTLRLE